jgi:hypothetical protein
MRGTAKWMVIPLILLLNSCSGEPATVQVTFLDEDAGTDAGESCPGQCVPEFPATKDWEPVLLWRGPLNEAPDCEALEPSLAWGLDGHLDLIVSNECPACACDPPVGWCEAPESFTVHSEACDNIPAGVDTSFDPVDGWNGMCTDEQKLSGARSLTVGVAKIHESRWCALTEGQIPHAVPPQPTWGSFARTCKMSEQDFLNATFGNCDGLRANCFPQFDGFRACYRREGVFACPAMTFPDQFVVYDGYTDDRTCSDCTCGPPEGSACEGIASVYEDSACSQFAGACQVDASNTCCVDLLPGTALGSKQVTDLDYYPGTCQPSERTVTGMAEPANPITYCCWVPDQQSSPR